MIVVFKKLILVSNDYITLMRFLGGMCKNCIFS